MRRPKLKQRGIDRRELATILAAIRFWQENNMPEGAEQSTKLSTPPVSGTLFGIATDDRTLDPLTQEEIDALCERINVVHALIP